MYCMSPDCGRQRIFSCTYSCSWQGQRLDPAVQSTHHALSNSEPQRFPNQEGWDTSSEMVNKIISHAQHILWAQAILLCLPPVALFTKNVFQVSREKTISARSQKEWEEIDKNPFFLSFQESWRLWKTILCSIFELISISMATWGRSDCSGQLPHRERDERWQGHKPKHKPSSILSSSNATHHPHKHHQHSHTDKEINCHKETETTK